MTNTTMIRSAARTSRLAGLALVTGALLVGSAPELSAQDDSRWGPFLGCWNVVSEGDVDTERVCIEPGDTPETAIWTSTFEDGESTVETVVADGAFRSVEDGACEAETAARFSDDGRRIYIDGRVDCADDDAEPITSGMLALLSTDLFFDVRSVEVEGQPTAWVQRYERAPSDDDSGRDAPRYRALSASVTPSWSTILDVNRNVSPSVAVAWLAEAGIREPVDGDRLVALADAGASDEVLDLVVALSNPGRFSFAAARDLDRVASSRTGGVRGRRVYGDDYDYARRRGAWGGFLTASPLEYWDRFFFEQAFLYGPYGYNYGFNPYVHVGPGGRYAPYPVVVVPSRPYAGNGGGGGRAVNGGGYNRANTATSGRPIGGGTAGGRGATVRGGSSRGGAAASSGSGAVRRDGGGSGSSSSSGRGAVRRGGGGDSGSSSSAGRGTVRRDGGGGGI